MPVNHIVWMIQQSQMVATKIPIAIGQSNSIGLIPTLPASLSAYFLLQLHTEPADVNERCANHQDRDRQHRHQQPA
jgi:hypothetical protein